MKHAAYIQERDRFVAFAFAAADLLLELDEEQRIVSVQGASVCTTGRHESDLIGKSFSDIIRLESRALVERLLNQIPRSGGRLSPIAVRIAHASGAQPVEVLGGCRMPTLAGHFFVTLTAAVEKPEVSGTRSVASGPTLLDRTALISAVERAAIDKGPPQPKFLTLARVDGLSQAAQTLPEDQSRRLVDEVTAVLRSRSIGGNIVGQVDADVFGFIEAGAPNAAELADELKNAVKNAGVAANLINPIIAMMSLAAEGLTEVDIRRAIAHAVKMTLGTDTMRKGRTSLKEQFAEACKATLVAVTKLRGQIDRREIVLVYQPIVDLAKRQPHHYEALARRLDGTTATEIITFGEEIGLIAEIDLMILRMALKQLGSGPGPAVAVNISGQSVQLEGFRTEMLALIGEGGVDSSRLMFELTESSTVDKVEEVAAYLKSLRGRGHAVCLDDFGAGAAAYGYLRNFEVDFVKLDGPFLRAAGENQRDRALVASVVKLCEELKCRTIGEMIETEADARAAAELGIGYGQGWLYGKPLSDLPAVPGQSARASKRIGARDSWG